MQTKAKPITKIKAKKGNSKTRVTLEDFMVFSPEVLILLCKFDNQADAFLLPCGPAFYSTTEKDTC
jgi:hypothetical protein